MKKQIMIVIISGILLAPLAFADEDGVKTTGEQKISQLDPLAITCTLDQGTKSRTLSGDQTSGTSSSGTARGRSAR